MVYDFLDQLPKEDQSVAYLFFREGMDQEDISTLLNIPRIEVNDRLNESRRIMYKLMNK